MRESPGAVDGAEDGQEVLVGAGLGGPVRAQATAQAAQVEDAQSDEGAGEEVERRRREETGLMA